MAILKRLSRLFRADIHSILDKIEDPNIILKQAIRDMEHELQILGGEIAVIQNSLMSNVASAKQIKSHAEDIQAKIRISFKLDNDELTKELIKKKLDIENKIKVMDAESTILSEQKLEVQEKYHRFEEKLQQIRAKEEVFSKLNTCDSEIAITSIGCGSISNNDVEIEFMQQKERWLKEGDL